MGAVIIFIRSKYMLPLLGLAVGAIASALTVGEAVVVGSIGAAVGAATVTGINALKKKKPEPPPKDPGPGDLDDDD
jgi:hypothetical protein